MSAHSVDEETGQLEDDTMVFSDEAHARAVLANPPEEVCRVEVRTMTPWEEYR